MRSNGTNVPAAHAPKATDLGKDEIDMLGLRTGDQVVNLAHVIAFLREDIPSQNVGLTLRDGPILQVFHPLQVQFLPAVGAFPEHAEPVPLTERIGLMPTHLVRHLSLPSRRNGAAPHVASQALWAPSPLGLPT